MRDEVHDRIRDAIVDGSLAPGQPLRDADLAEQLGLSRAPVREALKRLVAEGLVVTKPQSYTRVAPLDLQDVRDACAVVRAMHELAARTAVPLLAPTHVEAMEEANERFATAVHAGDVDGALVADDAVHDVLVHVAGNRALAATIERYTPLIRRLERRRFADIAGQRSIALHTDLIRLCREGDTEEAAAVTARIFSSLDEQLHSPA